MQAGGVLTQEQDEWGNLYYLPHCERGNSVATSVVIESNHNGDGCGELVWGAQIGARTKVQQGACHGTGTTATASI
jgi:hypothetical protein